MKKDLAEKTLESYNDVFADIVNGLLFGGQEIVKETDLVDADSASQYKAEGKIREQRRDVAKFWMKGKIRLCLYGFENQTKKDRLMPARIISYDGASYRDQIGKKNVLASGKLSPVVTLVLYFGMSKWRNRNLYSCLEIPPELKDYISNYRINVFEIAWLTPDGVSRFKSDFKIVADYFVQLRMNKNYIPSRDTIRHVDEVMGMMSALTGSRLYENVQQEFDMETRRKERDAGGVTMAGLFEQWRNEGVEEGIKLGTSQGISQGINETARKMFLMNVCPVEQISKVTGLSVEEIRRLAEEKPTLASR